jgi:Ion channel
MGGTWTQSIRQKLSSRRHTVLLVTIVIALSVRPMIGNAGSGPLVYSIAMLVVLLMSLYTIQIDDLVGERQALVTQKRRRSIVGWLLAVAAVCERLALSAAPSRGLFLVGSVGWLLFFCFITWSELRGIMKHREVTAETISMSISIYLLLGLTWGLLYMVIFELQPHAFNLGGSIDLSATQRWRPDALGPIFIYFSLTTLSTIGFGDITPVTLQARYAAVAEGITGQFYLAILVARLVGIYMSRTSGQDGGGQVNASAAD